MLKKQFYFILLCFCLFSSKNVFGEVPVDSVRIDSLSNLLHQIDDGEQKVNTYILIAKLYGYEAYTYENGETALEYLTKAHELAQSLNYQDGLCDILLVQIGVFQRRGDLDIAYKKGIEALEIAKSIQHLNYQHRAYNYLGILSSMLKEKTQAVENLEKAVAIAKKDNDIRHQGIYHSNLGFFYKKNNEFDKALEHQLIAEKLLNEGKAHPEDVIFNLVTLAETYQKKGDYLEAIDYFHKCLELSNYEDRLQNDLRIFKGLSSSYQALKMYDKAIKYIQLSIQKGEELKDPYWQSESYKVLSDIYEKLNMPQKALIAYKKHKEFSDKVYNEKQISATKELETKYKTQEKEQQLVMQELELAQKTQQRNIFIIVAILFLGLGWFLWQLYQRSQTDKKIIELQTAELQQLYDNKNRFFANIAHELRTPLTLIVSPIANILKDNSLPNTTRQRLHTVHRNTHYLKQLVTQILDLSKRDVEELNLQLNTFSLSDMLNALIDDFQNYATYQKIDFQTPLQLKNQIQLTTDGEKLFIVLKNLLSNAFKYTNSGGQVTLNYINMDNILQISVRDTGRGIAPNDLSQVFKPYFQVSNATIPIEGGTGIGLAICKEYIKQLNGTIQVNSEIGKGSTFIVQFPKQLQGELSTNRLSFLEHKEAILHDFTNVKADNDSPMLLIVEDNPDICQHLRDTLQADYQLLFANNGAEGIQQLQQNIPNLILTDLMMPVMDGFEFIEKVKAADQWRHIPIITLTARSEMADKLQALRIGVDDYLIKPFHDEELQIRIQRLLEYQENRQQFISEEIEKEAATNASDNAPTMKATPVISQEDEEWLKSLETTVMGSIGNLDFSAHQLCLEMAMSTSQLYRRVKLTTGMTPRKYIDQIRYHEARKMLEVRKYSSVKKVAYEIGLRDEKNFARNFKKRFGKYPSAYLE